MAAPSSGKHRRSSKLKTGTTSARAHRFESFNQRIAKLKIDPIRKRPPREDVLADDASFFKTSLERWRDLNLSQDFTNFVREVEPHCQSLPQVLHYSQSIFDLLACYIAKQDVLSLQPLLDLLSNLAHDLDVRFETFFPKAVALVATVAAKHPDVEVIEWSFTCLAWLFKYLSRLLVPNIGPLYHIMGPWLGKESQKPHTIRFAAEAMSFLVRKAAAAYLRTTEYLDIAIDTICSDFVEVVRAGSKSNIEQYQHGIMTLFVNAIKGVNRQLHSSGVQVYHCLFRRVLSERNEQCLELRGVLNGVTIALIHHSDVDGLKPILNCVLEEIEQVRPTTDDHSITTVAHVLFLLCTVRKGSRIQNWQLLVDAGSALLADSIGSGDAQIAEVLRLIAVIWQSAPLNIALPRLEAVMETITRDCPDRVFLSFCNYFNELCPERFQDRLTPYLSQFIATKWESNRLLLLSSLPKIVGPNPQRKPIITDSWQEHAIRQFRALRENDENIVECFQFLEAQLYIAIGPEAKKTMMEVLGKRIEYELRTDHQSSLKTFVLGAGLKAFARNSIDLPTYIRDWWPLICQKCRNYGSLLPFLEAIHFIVQSQDFQAILSQATIMDSDSVLHALTENLHSSSHLLRDISLRILKQICSKYSSEVSPAIDILLMIENSPLDLQSARVISLQARKLASTYAAASSNSLLRQIIPHFLFGMLTFKLSQVWNDVVAALKVICQSKCGEDIVSMLAFSWLEDTPSDGEHTEVLHSGRPEIVKGPLTVFECSNLADVETIIDSNVADVSEASEILRRNYNAVHTVHNRKPTMSPSMALRVLVGIPHVAEKRSRNLVPRFLEWARSEIEARGFDMVDENATLIGDDASYTSRQSWRQKDRKTMLDLFGQFTNPRALYQADDVFNAMKRLLSNGDVDTQRSALKAIFTWKLKELQPYEEHLLNILDDARFREEAAIFLNVEEQSTSIQNDHRATLMPILLRLLYGRMICRVGAKGGQGRHVSKRRAALQAIYHFENEYLGEFIRIALGELNALDLLQISEADEHRLVHNGPNVRKQLGLVNMIKSMLEVLNHKLTPFAKVIIEALLFCLLRAARQLSAEKLDQPQVSDMDIQVSLLKAVRHSGMQCLNLAAQCFSPDLLRPYLRMIFVEILSPRLQKLPVETAQSVSGILQLLSTWASSPSTVLILVEYDARTLKSVTDCLVTPSSKDKVKTFVLDNILLRSIECLGALGSEVVGIDPNPAPQYLRQKLLQPNAEHMLDRLCLLLQGSPNKDILASAIRLVAAMTPITEGFLQTQSLLKVSILLLNQPSHRVSPKSKGELLQIVVHFLPSVQSSLPLVLQEEIFHTIAALFGYFRDRGNRAMLSSALRAIATGDTELENTASLCEQLNAYSVRKVDEPDFDIRLRAFNVINESQFKYFSAKQWRPLLFNMLYYMKDNEELAIRSNASFALRRFVEASSYDAGHATLELCALKKSVLLPALLKGAAEASEVVRAEYLSVMAHLVRHNPQWEDVNDMYGLLVDNDDEASFFANILHIQQHRRLRALRRLATEASKGCLKRTNIAQFFLPLIEHFIFDKADNETSHNLSAESMTTIGALAPSLEWPQFRAMFRRFASYIQSKQDIEKSIITLLGVVTEVLSEAVALKERNANIADTPNAQVSVDHETSSVLNTLSRTMPKHDKLADELNNNILPSLTAYLHGKDDSAVSLRVTVAISVTKLLKLLPRIQFEERLPPMLLDVCNILRSRAQDSRDLSRKTLAEISKLIGPAYFGFLLSELRSVLGRGYQLHVLSFTLHSILVSTAAVYRPGDLDYCLPKIVAVIMDDIFGATGQEKEAEEYISKMKEVKSNKSFDSMELVSKMTKVDHLVHLIRPLQCLLEGKPDLRMVNKMDELLRRIGVGLLRNDATHDREVLIFCHEIIREAYEMGVASDGQTAEAISSRNRFLVTHNRAERAAKNVATSSYKYKLARFAFDILKSVFHKHTHLQTPSNVHGFIPLIGDAIVQSNEEIQTSALRLLTTLIKVPLKAIDDNAGIYVAECVKIVKRSTSTNVELVQAALKLVSAILRERHTFEIRETDLAYLLKRLIPDLEEPDKQGTAFSFLKAIMTLKVVVAEVYEVLDVVGTIMVTNQTRSVRDMARGAYFQFIMDYPQSKDRFSKQVSFLAKNLDYAHQEGRQSVLEAIHLLFTKPGEELVQRVFGTFFVPLVIVIVNDESSQCREMAGALLRTLFERADAERVGLFLSMLRSWLGQEDQPLLTRAAIQIYGVYLDTHGTKAENEVVILQRKVAQILKAQLKQSSGAAWELIYSGLLVFTKICQILPSSALGSTTATLWRTTRLCLSFPHAWVKLSAAKLLGIYLADFARANATNQNPELPLKGSGGLRLTEQEIVQSTRASLGLLRVTGVSEELASQSVRNLIFLGKLMGQTAMRWPRRVAESRVYSEGDQEFETKADEEMETTGTQPLGIHELICRCCSTLRCQPQTTRAPSLIPLNSTLQLLAVLTNHFTIPTLRPLIGTILLPLQNLTDGSIPGPFSTDDAFIEGYKTLVSNAKEMMSVLQEKLGTTEYLNVLQDVRENIKKRREGRRTKRVIERVANPEKAGREKKRRGEHKRVKRKERSAEERSKRRGW
ncbi:MAG: hypothetical protein Q9163_003100 [Psora crenata]